MTFLARIVKNKQAEVRRLKRLFPLEALKKQAAGLSKKKARFFSALEKKKPVSVIAEIKRRSPSRGTLCRAFDPVPLARGLEKGGAAALSVLTDERFFGGSLLALKNVKSVSGLPVLRKDFIIDEYQIWESRLLGADAILLIAAILSKEQLRTFTRLARRLGLDALIEVHGPAELKKVLPLKPRWLGVNNRDLETFEVALSTTEKLLRRIPERVFIVSESGIKSKEDLLYLERLGVRSVLIGEGLMTRRDPGRVLKALLKSLTRG
ncbi:MAG: indole-3-glycerol phosphate synthase TrpC [Candidatus Omnitrophica bacterium]|nr:indole-3-glycerol phosphate synthase TrpC [Candidatus Omnitrophota bacterium]